MGPALTDAELAALYPHLEPWQRVELEQWHRWRHHAWMQGQSPPGRRSRPGRSNRRSPSPKPRGSI